MIRVCLLILFALLAPASVAHAHGEAPPTPQAVWGRWNFDPLLVSGLLLIVARYGLGVRALWQRAGVGRGVSRGQVLAFAGGMMALVVALVSPLAALSESLSLGHMFQHLLLMLVAAPLLVVGAPPVALAWALPREWRPALARAWRRAGGLRSVWHAISRPVPAWLLHAAALWLWHIPSFYDAALWSEPLHYLEHLAFFGTALLFWHVIVRCGQPGALGHGAGVLYLFTMSLASAALGALMTLAAEPWYASYAATTQAWGLTPLEDQQLAGAVMWVPANFVYLAGALALLWAWFQMMERRAPALG